MATGTTPKQPRTFTRTLATVFSVLILAAVALGGISYASGIRQFTVRTPSMAEYAPVGTVVLSKPANFDNIKKGDTILFKPPASGETYFHRVVQITPQGLKTKGDLNGTVDPWTITKTNFVGKELLHVHNLGFFIQALPIFIIGGILLQVLSHFYIDKLWRFPARVFGWSLIISIAAWVTRPFVKAVLISQTVVDHKATTIFVPTGILPVDAQAWKGSHILAVPGQLAHVISAHHNTKGYYNVNLTPHFGFWTAVIFAGIWLIPTLLCILYAIHARKHGYDLIEEPVVEEPTETANIPA